MLLNVAAHNVSIRNVKVSKLTASQIVQCTKRKRQKKVKINKCKQLQNVKLHVHYRETCTESSFKRVPVGQTCNYPPNEPGSPALKRYCDEKFKG
jgi:hypothetical protein